MPRFVAMDKNWTHGFRFKVTSSRHQVFKIIVLYSLFNAGTNGIWPMSGEVSNLTGRTTCRELPLTAMFLWQSIVFPRLHQIRHKGMCISKCSELFCSELGQLEILNIVTWNRLHALTFVHASHKGIFTLLNHSCQYASNVHNYTTRYVANQNLHKFRVKTNTGKQMISFMAIDLWQEIPKKFKDLNQLLSPNVLTTIYVLSQLYQT